MLALGGGAGMAGVEGSWDSGAWTCGRLTRCEGGAVSRVRDHGKLNRSGGGDGCLVHTGRGEVRYGVRDET